MMKELGYLHVNGVHKDKSKVFDIYRLVSSTPGCNSVAD